MSQPKKALPQAATDTPLPPGEGAPQERVGDIPSAAQRALNAFSTCQGWEQRARLLMQWGEQLAALSDAERCEANRVTGCESQVWLLAERDGAHWQFRASSKARLLRGLLALLLARVNGLPRAQLQQLDLPDWFTQLGLARQLSPSRSNGLQAVLTRMQQLLDAADQGAINH